jgi:PilZ domain
MLPRLRNAPRRRVLKTGLIELADTCIECTVRDLSGSGAALEVVTPLYIPDRFTLFIPSEQLKRKCRIAWRTGSRMGVTFA